MVNKHLYKCKQSKTCKYCALFTAGGLELNEKKIIKHLIKIMSVIEKRNKQENKNFGNNTTSTEN